MNYQRRVEVRSGSEADEGRRVPVRRAGPEPEGASVSDQIE